MEKEEDKATKELLVQYGVNISRLKEFREFLEALQEFVQYLGTNQYYSDAVNKKIFLLTLDVDAALLRLGRLSLTASSFKESVLRAKLSKKFKSLPGQKEVDAFQSDFALLEKEVVELHERSIALTEDIREEYKRKDHV